LRSLRIAKIFKLIYYQLSLTNALVAVSARRIDILNARWKMMAIRILSEWWLLVI